MSTPPIESPENLVEMLNGLIGGFNKLMGLRFTIANADEVCAEVPVRSELWQPYGLVHGGVYAAMVETLASAGAAITAGARGQSTVGLENSTSFVRGVREGTLRGRALPITRGRRTQVWEVTIRDDEERIAATGRVRLLCLEAGAVVGGETVKIAT